MKRTSRSRPRWRYDPHRAVLDLYGSQLLLDLGVVKRLFETHQVPISVSAVVYESKWLPHVSLIVTGHVLSDWLANDWPYPLCSFIACPVRPPKRSNRIDRRIIEPSDDR
jgi:hypothetical protein